MFSDRDIQRAISSGRLTVDPYDRRLLQPASLDLRLGGEFLSFRVPTVGYIDPAVDQTSVLYERQKVEDHFFLHPGQLVIATTREHLEFPLNIVGRLEGKSSLGRLGILVHSTAGFFDPGFRGQATLELTNISPAPVKLYVGMPVAQMSFTELDTVATQGYSGKYQGQTGPQPSSYHENFGTGRYMGSRADD
jgi:dCTP deaminase